MALVVLGAGATRGCSFVDAGTIPCVPPLDTDFFSQLQRVENPKHQSLIKDVLSDVVELFGTNFSAGLETVFSTLEHTIRMLETTGDNREFKRPELQDMRIRLLQAIAVCLEESLTKSGSSRESKKCKHHEVLVKELLKPRDCIVSFN